MSTVITPKNEYDERDNTRILSEWFEKNRKQLQEQHTRTRAIEIARETKERLEIEIERGVKAKEKAEAKAEAEMEIEREKTRIRGEEFKKWQRESKKMERIRSKNAETAMIKEIAKETEREKAQIRCEAD